MRKIISSNNNQLFELSKELENMQNNSSLKATMEYDKFLSTKNLTKEEYFEILKNTYEKQLQDSNIKENLVEYMKNNNYSENIIELLETENVTAEELAYQEINEQINKIAFSRPPSRIQRHDIRLRIIITFIII